MSRRLAKPFALLCVAGLIGAACSSNGGSSKTTSAPNETSAPSTSGGSETTAGATETTGGPTSSLLPDNGPCDTSKSPVDVALFATLESPVLTLKAQGTAAEAAVKAFNKRGGIGGHCMGIKTYNDGADPNVAADLARKIVASDAVATLNDTTTFGDGAVSDIFKAANFPRVAQSPATADYTAPISYNLGGGGLGTTFMMVPGLTNQGVKKIAAIHVDAAAFAAAIPILKKVIEANGAQLVADIPVPAGTTNYDQFILAAQDAGAEGIMMPLGDKESIQVLNAAQQLGTTLKFSLSLGTFSKANVAKYADFAKQWVFNAEVPPANATDQFPALQQVIDDLSVSGDADLQKDTLQSSAVRSWLAVYSFVKVMSTTDVDHITRESVTAAFNAAKDIDMLGIMKPWTPNQASPGVFNRISNPWYYFATWDGKDFVLGSKTPDVSLIDLLKPTGLMG